VGRCHGNGYAHAHAASRVSRWSATSPARSSPGPRYPPARTNDSRERASPAATCKDGRREVGLPVLPYRLGKWRVVPFYGRGRRTTSGFQHGWLFNLRSNFNSRNGWILLFAAKRITAMDFVCSCGVLWRIFIKIFR
jgi:hypothetical protein